MLDFKLDPITHDLAIEDFDFQIVNELDYVIQKLKIRLLFLYGEYFLDTTLGVKYFDLILVKNPDITVIDSVIKATILETEHVLDIIEYQSDYDAGQRTFSVDFTVNTDFGTATLSIPEVI